MGFAKYAEDNYEIQEERMMDSRYRNYLTDNVLYAHNDLKKQRTTVMRSPSKKSVCTWGIRIAGIRM